MNYFTALWDFASHGVFSCSRVFCWLSPVNEVCAFVWTPSSAQYVLGKMAFASCQVLPCVISRAHLDAWLGNSLPWTTPRFQDASLDCCVNIQDAPIHICQQVPQCLRCSNLAIFPSSPTRNTSCPPSYCCEVHHDNTTTDDNAPWNAPWQWGERCYLGHVQVLGICSLAWCGVSPHIHHLKGDCPVCSWWLNDILLYVSSAKKKPRRYRLRRGLEWWCWDLRSIVSQVHCIFTHPIWRGKGQMSKIVLWRSFAFHGHIIRHMGRGVKWWMMKNKNHSAWLWGGSSLSGWMLANLSLKALGNLLYDFASDIGLMVWGLLQPHFKIASCLPNPDDIVLEREVEHIINNIGSQKLRFPTLPIMPTMNYDISVCDIFETKGLYNFTLKHWWFAIHPPFTGGISHIEYCTLAGAPCAWSCDLYIQIIPKRHFIWRLELVWLVRLDEDVKRGGYFLLRHIA